VLAVIGASVLLCCTGSGASASAGSHIGAGVLIASAAIVHAVAVIVYIVFWANVVNAVNDNCDDGVYSNPDDPNNQDEVDCDALSGGLEGARCREGLCKKPIPVVRPAPPHATRRERLHRRANLANHRHRHRHLLCRAHLRDLLLPGGSGGQGPSPPHHCGRARREARLRSDAVEPSPPQAGAHIAVNSRVWSVGRSRDVCICLLPDLSQLPLIPQCPLSLCPLVARVALRWRRCV